MEIIVLVGNEGVGKNFAAEAIVGSDAEATIFRLEDPLRIAAAAMYRIAPGDFTCRRARNEPRGMGGRTPVESLRRLAAMFYSSHGEQFFLHQTKLRLKPKLNSDGLLVIPDVSDPLVWDWLDSIGAKSVRITRTGYEPKGKFDEVMQRVPVAAHIHNSGGPDFHLACQEILPL